MVDTPDQHRIVADRERVGFDASDVVVDIKDIRTRLRKADAPLATDTLETIARQLELVFLDGLDGAGDAAFETWLMTEREDLRVVRADVLKRLVTHPDMSPPSLRRWLATWRDVDPDGAEEYERAPTAQEAQEPIRTNDKLDQVTSTGTGNALSPDERTSASAEETTRSRKRALRAQRIGFCEARDGTKIAYATVGSGPPILKAANWLNHLEFDWASPIWGGSFTALAQHRTFIRYDERGCGLSDWDVDDLSFEAFVDDLEAVADRLKLERFPLLGISQGAAVSIEYAVRHPDRVSGLILIGGYAAGWRHLATPDEQARREAVLKLTEVGWGTDNPAYRHIFSQTFMPDADADDLAWFDEFQRQTTSPQNAARFQDAFGYIDVRERLAEVKAPTIVLHSKDDQRIPLELGRAVASGIPNARFVPLESRNHILVDHEPAWAVCFDTVVEFLTENGV